MGRPLRGQVFGKPIVQQQTGFNRSCFLFVQPPEQVAIDQADVI
jgi:hypothetical protein